MYVSSYNIYNKMHVQIYIPLLGGGLWANQALDLSINLHGHACNFKLVCCAKKTHACKKKRPEERLHVILSRGYRGSKLKDLHRLIVVFTPLLKRP